MDCSLLELQKDNEKSGCRLTADALLCEAYTNFGNLYDAQEKRQEAVDFHTRALNLAVSIGKYLSEKGDRWSDME